LKLLLALLSLFALTACNTMNSGAPMPQPVSQQSSDGDARNRARVHTELGYAYYEAKRMSQALDEARVAMGIDSGYPLAYNLLGLVYMDLRENAAAENAFQQALQLAPGDPDISNNYGWFLCQTRREKQSLNYFQTAAKNPLYSSPAVALTNGAQCAEKIGDTKSADEILARAVLLDPTNPRVLFLAADMAYQRGRFGEAKRRLSDLNRVAPLNAETVWLGLRIARKQADRNEEARYVALMRQRFSESAEFKKLSQGQYE
jgi:type IV pilus assembly protein PilF